MIMKMNYSLNKSEMLRNINKKKETEWNLIRLHWSGWLSIERATSEKECRGSNLTDDSEIYIVFAYQLTR